MNIILKIIRNPARLGYFVLRKTSFLFPDRLYLQLMFRFYAESGGKLDLKNPRNFNEKIQWLKLYNRNPEYTRMVDKFEVKQYVAPIIGTAHIIPTIGVWDDPDKIDFDRLPDQFVLKCNHNSGTGMYICKDKKNLDIKAVKRGLRKGLKENYFRCFREWPYKNVKRKIIAEPFMKDGVNPELRDYKFFCFGGVPKLCQVISDRSVHEKIDFYDMNWIRQRGLIGLNLAAQNSEMDIPCPVSFKEMKIMAEKLSANIPFVRIDFYNINGRAYFGEITFFPASGFGKFKPEIWNERIGNWVKLPIEKMVN